MSRAAEDRNRRLLRARDTIDRSFAAPLDVAALARVAHVSPAHFARQFRAVFGETPHRYLQRRRIERAMELLRDTDRPVTEVCLDVGFASLGHVQSHLQRRGRRVALGLPGADRGHPARHRAIRSRLRREDAPPTGRGDRAQVSSSGEAEPVTAL
jgi:AraC-like DNA-binding protein